MTMPAQNTLLQTPRTSWAFLQHLHVVIGFQDEHVGVSDSLGDQSRDMAQISGEAEVCRGRAQEKAHRVLCIMWNGKRLHRYVTDFKTRSRGEQAKFCLGAGDTLG